MVITTLIHEVFHILGFTNALFEYYMDWTKTGTDKTIGLSNMVSTQTQRGKQVQLIILPQIV